MIRFRILCLVLMGTLLFAPYQKINARPSLMATAAIAAVVTGSIFLLKYGKKLYYRATEEATYRFMPSLRPSDYEKGLFNS